MATNNNITKLDFSPKSIHEKVDLVYRHNLLMSDYAVTSRDYGEDNYMSEIEAHTLDYICDNQGITITQLSTDNYRTKGAISQLITKLENKGLVERRKERGNKKNVFLYPTKKGENASSIHRNYDYQKTVNLIRSLLDFCSENDIEGFYRVLELRVANFEKEYQNKNEI